MRAPWKYASFLALFLCRPALCQIAPARLEINLGPVPIDKYHPDGLNAGTIPSCPDSWTVPRCIKRMFKNVPSDPDYTPNNYMAQGVKGVRFMFGLGGGAHSTAFDTSGGPSSTWLNKLQAFYLEWAPKLRQPVKTHFTLNGEESHGPNTKEVHERVQGSRGAASGARSPDIGV